MATWDYSHLIVWQKTKDPVEKVSMTRAFPKEEFYANH